MALRPFLALAALAALVAAGCVTPNAADLQRANALAIELPSLDPATYLFADAQNAPHPKFGWPTLVAPAQGENVPVWWQPIAGAELPESIAGIASVAQTEGVTSAGGIALFGSLAVVPGFGDLSWIVDIRDPAAPVVLSEFEPVQSAHRGAAVVAYPDGKLVAAFSTGEGFELWDITDPTKPVNVATAEPTTGGHKLGVVPGTPILYNANSWGGASQTPEGGNGQTEIYDLTDPSNPVLVQEFKNGFGCHHIFFWNSAEKQRAVCAGIEFTQIWDIADPLAPVVLVNVPVHHGNPDLPSASVWTTPGIPPGLFAFSHFGILNDDGTILIVGDEMGGGGFPPGCVGRVGTPVRDVTTPFGALWFYDVSDETSPELLGWFSPGLALAENPPDAGEGPFSAFYNCTAHHGRLVPDPEGRDLLAMSFYRSGVVLVDFSDPTAAKLVDQQVVSGQNTWETWYYNGHLFTGDLGRGLEVLSFE